MVSNVIRRVLVALLCSLSLVGPAQAEESPRLVVQITVDQLRGDMPARFRGRFGEGGFRYLMERGLWYSNAHYRHLTTMTSVGHATLFTGSCPAQHGIIANYWMDRSTGKRVYSVADARYPVIGAVGGGTKGASPGQLIGNTIGDSLVLASNRRARVFSVSLKDRGAILPGGRQGKAFWYESRSGRFVSSRYYFKSCPDWVTKWNEADHAGAYSGKAWTLLNERGSYLFAEQDERLFEKSFKNLGRVFPHALGSREDGGFYSKLRFTPMADAVLLKFVQELIVREKLGQGPGRDMLAVSFSATDYIGHAFGPNSLEYEDNLMRLDRTLAGLFGFLAETVGLDRCLIVLSSDHGVDAAPETRRQKPPSNARTGAGRLIPHEFLADVNKALRKRFAVDKDLVKSFWTPYLYLDREALREGKLEARAVERFVATFFTRRPGFAYALARSDLLAGRIMEGPLSEQIRRSFHPKRSGDVLLIQEPFWLLYHNPYLDTAMHGSPYGYDTHVPIFISVPGLKARRITRRVDPADIAPTLAQLLSIEAPAGADGAVLEEAVEALEASGSQR